MLKHFPFQTQTANPLAIIALAFGLFLTPSIALNFVVIGDSASDEYALEVPFSLPESPSGHVAMNWVEWATALRGNQINFGEYREPFVTVPWADLRSWGYEGNFSFPGHHSDDGADLVEGSTVFDTIGRLSLDSLIRGWADIAVVFLGANDLRDEYEDIYQGKAGAEDAFVTSVSRDLNTIVKYLAEDGRDLKIVLVNVPDVSAAPDEIKDHPDANRRANAGRATARLNEEIKKISSQWDTAVADVYTSSEEIINTGGITINDVFLIGEGSSDNDTQYLFARDDFHPNSGAQLLYAQAIVKAANDKFGVGIDPISNSDILDALALSPGSTPFPTASNIGSQWQRLSGFGDFFSGSFPWIFHNDLNWAWAAGSDPQDLWLWTEALGFIWTNDEIYPNIFSLERDSWLWFDVAGDSLFDFSKNSWIPAPF